MVAGGYTHIGISRTTYDTLSTVVEVLDIHNKQWSTGPSTPTPCSSMMSTIIGDTWYLMGGWCCGTQTVDVYSASLDSLVSQVTPNNYPRAQASRVM